MKKFNPKLFSFGTFSAVNLQTLLSLIIVGGVLIIVSCSDEEIIFQSRPIADAGDDQQVQVFYTVYLNKDKERLSEDAEYIWTFKYKPEGSKVCFSDSSSPNPTFIPDIAGYYYVQLIIWIGDQYSEPGYSLIYATFKESEQYFPNTVGNKWVYKTTNSASGFIDTLLIEITGTTTLPGNKQVNIWTSTSTSSLGFHNDWDTLYLYESGDSLIFYRYRWNLYHPEMIYLIPFTVGDTINYYPIDPYTIVEANDPVTLDIGTFDSAFFIIEKRYSANYGLGIYSWIMPRVGLVKRDISENDFGDFYDEHWELIWYHLEE